MASNGNILCEVSRMFYSVTNAAKKEGQKKKRDEEE
jgi:hypothetical protein